MDKQVAGYLQRLLAAVGIINARWGDSWGAGQGGGARLVFREEGWGLWVLTDARFSGHSGLDHAPMFSFLPTCHGKGVLCVHVHVSTNALDWCA